MQPYTKDYYELIRQGSLRSAQVIVPLMLRLVPAKSVVDIGCGDGTWLSIFAKSGVTDIFGLDGEYVGDDFLQIPKDRFRAADLKQPFTLERSFDVAVSLEVAEHLPTASSASFVESLTRLAPMVMFSAALPFQGGNHHINEQWPSFWTGLFGKHGYVPIDYFRKYVWENEAVDWWYAQNILLFARAELVEARPELKREFELTNQRQLALIHPRNFLEVVEPVRPVGVDVFGALRLLGLVIRNAAWRRIHRVLKKREGYPRAGL
jgi:SAM-dependent methyltransferase